MFEVGDGSDQDGEAAENGLGEWVRSQGDTMMFDEPEHDQEATQAGTEG